MKNLIIFLFVLLMLGSAGAALGQTHPKVKAKRAFNHTAESAKGKNNKVHFRKENIRPVVDLNPHSPEKFKTAKAKHHYKFSKVK